MAFMEWFLSNKAVGILILGLLGLQGLFMVLSPGSLRIQKPQGGAMAWVFNALNLGFLLGLTPLLALCLIGGLQTVIAWGQWQLDGTTLSILRLTGLIVYLAGNILLYWSRVALGKSFRLGAVPPDRSNRLIVSGPFQFIRHPMYTAVVLMMVGLGLILAAWFLLVFTLVFIAVIIRLIPIEERQLAAAYPNDYRDFQSKTWRLIPWIY